MGSNETRLSGFFHTPENFISSDLETARAVAANRLSTGLAVWLLVNDLVVLRGEDNRARL
jgi:hypothetical protein